MTHWHAVSADEALRALESTPRGLSSAEAAGRLARDGPNRLTERRGRGPVKRFLVQFHNVLIYVLLAAAGVTAALGHAVDTGVILGVVLINAVVGFLQEGKAEKALAAIRRMLSLKALVLRDGRQVSVDAETLVRGDLVLLQSGDRVPADLRLARVKGLRIDEAALTGESQAAEKRLEPVAADAALGDRIDMAFSGTLVASGTGAGVVVATGDATEFGRISTLIGETERIDTPLLRKIAGFGRGLSVATLVIAAATFASVARSEDVCALREVLRTMEENGVTVFDTAPGYGASEEVAGTLAAEIGISDRIFWATKVNVAGRGGGGRRGSTIAHNSSPSSGPPSSAPCSTNTAASTATNPSSCCAIRATPASRCGTAMAATTPSGSGGAASSPADLCTPTVRATSIRR